MATEIIITFFKTIFCFVMLSTVYLAIMVKAHSLKAKGNEMLTKYYYKFKYTIIVHVTESFNWTKLLTSLQEQDYQNFNVLFVVSKNAKIPETINLKKYRIFENCILESKLEILDYVVNIIKPDTEAIAYIKGNCVIEKDFISNINNMFNKGFDVTQCNILKSNSSKLHSAKGNFRNLIERKNRVNAGLSSTIAEQGFVIKLSVLKLLDLSPSKFDDDKKLQSNLIMYNNSIGYADSAKLIDNTEVTPTNTSIFHLKQSMLLFYYYYLGLKILCNGINTQNFDKINFGANYMRPPVIVMSLLCVGVLYLTLYVEHSFTFFSFICIITFIMMLFLTFNSKLKQIGSFQTA